MKILNANWQPDPDGGDGRFELLVITEDDQRHTVPASVAATATITTLAIADTTLVWDPTNQTLIVANIVGTMPWTLRRTDT
ncbi:MAG TPA: hypothetical protein VFL65_08835 [Jatrophihabitans sp.]|nr:hypothetical protein [Jatrophihabitans sp.]